MCILNLLARPGQKLSTHLINVAKLSHSFLEEVHIKSAERLPQVGYLIGLTHDFGKATTFFQRYLITKEKSEKARHSMISSLFAYYVVKKVIGKDPYPLFAWISVMKHHSDLENLSGNPSMRSKIKDSHMIRILKLQARDILEHSLKNMESIYSRLDIDITEFLKKVDDIVLEVDSYARQFYKKLRPHEWKHYYHLLLLYSALIDADNLDATGLSPQRPTLLPHEAIERYTSTLAGRSSKMGRLRSKAYKEVLSSLEDIDLEKDRILTIELPTGSGKTLIGLSTALRLRDMIKERFGFVPRIVYSLPYLSIIDQAQEVINEIFGPEFREALPSTAFIAHHHLSDINYKTEDEELDIERANLLIEGWYSHLVLTTFVQLFHSLVTNRRGSIRKFHNIVNSIIILDEIQAIDYKFWKLVHNSLESLTEQMNCWILLMTATQPLIFSKTKNLVKKPEKYYSILDRVTFSIRDERMTLEDLVNEISRDLLAGGTVPGETMMVVLNTIESSRRIYEMLKERLSKRFGSPKIDNLGIADFGDLEMIYLSTHVVPLHRRARIRRVRQDGERKVIISTQLVEAGVDISVDRIIRDIAPIDSIVQTAGRCNRNFLTKKGRVDIVKLVNEKGRYYATNIYGTTLIDIAERILDELKGIKSEKEFVMKAIKSYYEEVNRRTAPSVEILEALKWFRFSELRKFKLIEEEPWKSDVFVELDERASDLLQSFRNIFKMKDFKERRNNFLRIKKDFFEYVIDVEVTTKLDEVNGMYVVENRKLDIYYSLETGFLKKPRMENIL